MQGLSSEVCRDGRSVERVLLSNRVDASYSVLSSIEMLGVKSKRTDGVPLAKLGGHQLAGSFPGWTFDRRRGPVLVASACQVDADQVGDRDSSAL